MTEPFEPGPGPGLARARIALLLAGYVVVGAAACGIFDQFEWALLAAPLAPAAIAVLLLGRRGWIRAGGAAIAVIASAAIAVAVNDGGVGDLVDAFSSGVQGLLSTDWPSPSTPELIGTVAAVIATATAVSSELASRRRVHLLPLAPLIAVYIAAVGLSAPLGVDWWWLGLLAGVSIVFAMLHNEGSLHDRIVLLRGERRLVPLILIAVALVVTVAIPVSLTARADPRRNDPAEQTAPLLDPIEATIALRQLDPVRTLHVVTSRQGGALPLRWRTAALESYDGRRWSPTLTLRPIGSTLGPVTGPTVSADISFLDDNLTLVPLTGAPVSVDAPVETDADRTVVRLAERVEAGTNVAVVANVAPTISGAIEQGVATRLVDESSSGLTELAVALAGSGTPIDQLTRLETTLRDDFVLDSQVQGGGLQQALIDRFLRDTQRGTREQFATAFVLLARSLGIEARVATGFVITDTTPPSPAGSLDLRSSDAVVWPEVQLTDGSWLSFDPVPAEESTDGAPPPPDPQVQTPAAPQPPIAPPPDPENDTTATDDTTATTTDGALSTIVTWTLRGVAGITVLMLPFVLAAGLILAVKQRRKRRRLTAPSPADRIRGAWASATDALVDAGLDIDNSATDAEIARRGEPLVADGRRELHRLSKLSSAATYGSPEHPDLLADDAAKCLDSVDTAMATVRTRWQRLRWRLSLRSLRPATRSPLTR